METAFRATVRALCVAITVVMTVWGSSAAHAATRPSRCATPGKVFPQGILFSQKNSKRVDVKWLFLVCKPNREVVVVDSDGRSYKDLADFRAHNHLFTKDDQISVPRDFPSIDPSEKAGSMTVSGHTDPSPPWRWLIGGIVLVLVVVGGVLWRRARWRRAWDLDADPQDPSP